jgi:hypothetical protein
MAVSFVNGYLCTCSCDAAKARRGVDPHQQTDGVQSDPKTQTKNGVVTPDKPAVTFGGSLSGTSTTTGADAVTPVAASQGASINLLV